MSAKKNQRISTNAKSSPSSRLPVALLATVLFLVAAAAVLLQQSTQQSPTVASTGAGRPQLVVDQDRIDLGPVPVNQMVKASFKLTNAGDRPLTLAVPPVARVAEGC